MNIHFAFFISSYLPLLKPNISVNPNLLYLFPYEIYDSLFEISLWISKSDCPFDTFEFYPCLLKLFNAVSVNTKSLLSGLYLLGLRKTMLHNLS
jgi:hypothetical protein